jgi:hypothetical protein
MTQHLSRRLGKPDNGGSRVPDVVQLIDLLRGGRIVGNCILVDVPEVAVCADDEMGLASAPALATVHAVLDLAAKDTVNCHKAIVAPQPRR